jgi:hypothetical protein
MLFGFQSFDLGVYQMKVIKKNPFMSHKLNIYDDLIVGA